MDLRKCLSQFLVSHNFYKKDGAVTKKLRVVILTTILYKVSFQSV